MQSALTIINSTLSLIVETYPFHGVKLADVSFENFFDPQKAKTSLDLFNLKGIYSTHWGGA